jgi:hypothetical protein
VSLEDLLLKNVHYVTDIGVLTINDKSTRDYTINNTSLMTYVNANPNVELYFPDGTYHLQSGLTFTSGVSLNLHQNAKIIADNTMDVMLYFSNTVTASSIDSYKLFQRIRGGQIEGNNLVNTVVKFDNDMQTYVSDTIIQNGLQRGLVSNQPHAELMMNNVYFRNVTQLTGTTDNVTDNVAIEINSTDNYINNINIVDWTVGVRVTKPGNYLDKIHVWNTHLARIPLSIGFHVTSTGWMKLHYCVSDTCQTGFKNEGVLILDHCHILNNSFFSASFSGIPTGINNTSTYTNCQAKNVIFDGGSLGLNCFASASAITGIIQDNIYWGTLTNKPNELFTNSIKSFTPTFVGSTNAGTPTYITQFGQYTKVGKIVMFQINIKATFDSAISGDLTINGLPLISASGQTPLSVSYRSGFVDQIISANVISSNTKIQLWKTSSATTPVTSTITADSLQTKVIEIWVSGSYLTTI